MFLHAPAKQGSVMQVRKRKTGKQEGGRRQLHAPTLPSTGNVQLTGSNPKLRH